MLRGQICGSAVENLPFMSSWCIVVFLRMNFNLAKNFKIAFKNQRNNTGIRCLPCMVLTPRFFFYFVFLFVYLGLHSWSLLETSGNHMWCYRVKPGLLLTRQASYLLYSLSVLLNSVWTLTAYGLLSTAKNDFLRTKPGVNPVYC